MSKKLPNELEQNPSPVGRGGQEYQQKVRGQVESNLEIFKTLLPSNYVSRVPGPFYWQQFQVAAEALAEIQIEAQEAYKDSNYDYTRPEFLFSILGALIHPDGDLKGIPRIEGDTSYRDYLKAMVELLLQGATLSSVEAGAQILAGTGIVVKATERTIGPDSPWGFDDRFTFELDMSTEDGQGLPEDLVQLQENIRIALDVLKPAHTLYEQRNLIKELVEGPQDEQLEWDMSHYRYDDVRKFCQGSKEVTGTAGETMTDRYVFQDTSRDFSLVRPGAILTISSGDNTGRYTVASVSGLIAEDEPTEYGYTSSPSGLTGQASVAGGVISDSLQDFSVVSEGETLTFTAGPNAGTYRISACAGTDGGYLGSVEGSSTGCVVSASRIRVASRMPRVAVDQIYQVQVDRLGTIEVKTVTGEDVSSFFWR